MLLAFLLALACAFGLGQAVAAPEPPPTPGSSISVPSPPAGDHVVVDGLQRERVQADASPSPAEPAEPERPFVTVIGIPGLRWSDVTPEATPALWELAGGSAVAAMSVRTALPTACPLDGWLTLNSGARSIAPRDDGDCTPVPEPGDGRVPGWADLLEENAKYSYDPAFGTLADPGFTTSQNVGTCAVGPGAAVATADAEGKLPPAYAQTLDELPDDAVCTMLLVVDAGALPTTEQDRAAALEAADGTVQQTLDRVGDDGTVIVAGLADRDPEAAHLSAVLLRERDAAAGWLRAPSTRRAQLVQVTDLTATVLHRSGRVAARDGVGSVLESRPRGGDTAAAVRNLHRLDVAAETVRTNFVWFFVVLIAGQVLTYAAVGAAYLRGRLDRRRAGGLIRGVGLAFGAAPVASFLVNLAPWEATGRPAAALWAGLVGISAALAALALAGPWRTRPFGPAGFVAAVTLTVLAADVATGSELQLNALYGLSPLVAGRFYGFGNVAFAVFAMAALVTAAWAGAELARRDPAPAQRARAAAVVAGIGGVAVAIDGWPSFGADFGGVLALFPGVAVLALGVAGRRLTAVRAAGVAVLALAAVALIAVADWRRPEADRSHLGRFVQDVVDGEALDVVRRKLDANLGLLVDAPVIVAVAVPLIALVVVALVRPATLRLGGLAEAQDREPVLKILLVACVTTALVGFAVNDSGIIVPAVALTAAGPLATALWAGIWAGTASGPPRPRASR